MPVSRGWIEPNRERAERILLEDGTIMSIQEARATGVVTESPFSCNKGAAEPTSRSQVAGGRIDPQLQNPRPIFAMSVAASGVWETAADVARLHSNFEDALSPVGVSEPAEELEPGGEAGAGEVWDDARFVALSHIQDLAPAAGANRNENATRAGEAVRALAKGQRAVDKRTADRNRRLEKSEGGKTREQDATRSEGAATRSEHDENDVGDDHECANRRASTHDTQAHNCEATEATQQLSKEEEGGEEEEDENTGTDESSDGEGSSAGEHAHRKPPRGGCVAAHGREDTQENPAERSAEAEMRIIKSQRQEYECMICLQVRDLHYLGAHPRVHIVCICR
jgi:hypothetical protein